MQHVRCASSFQTRQTLATLEINSYVCTWEQISPYYCEVGFSKIIKKAIAKFDWLSGTSFNLCFLNKRNASLAMLQEDIVKVIFVCLLERATSSPERPSQSVVLTVWRPLTQMQPNKNIKSVVIICVFRSIWSRFSLPPHCHTIK